jgi:hypothetical protein
MIASKSYMAQNSYGIVQLKFQKQANPQNF